MSEKANAQPNFQDPLIRPDVNLQFLSGLVLVGLPLIVLFLTLAKMPEASSHVANTTLFKPQMVVRQPAQ